MEELDNIFYEFILKYDTVPGDLINATSFFGSTTSDGYSDTIHNGNGNGIMDYSESYNDMLSQLRGAEFIVGRSANSANYFPEVAPEKSIAVFSNYSANWYGYRINEDNHAAFLLKTDTATFSIFKAVDIYLIEQKVDDKLPVSGKYRTYTSSADCLLKIGGGSLPATTAYTNATVEYNKSATNPTCGLLTVFDSLKQSI